MNALNNIQQLPRPTQNVVFNLVDRKIGGKTIQTVNARDLHEFLGVKSEFRNWIKNRIDDYDFYDGSDFTTTVKKYRGGERKDYFVTLSMAKELCMVERNEKGKQARKYFIECERKLQSLSSAELSTKWDRYPLYGFAVDTVLRHKVLFSKVYELLNTYVGKRHFKDMTKSEAAEVLEFADRFAAGLDTRSDWIRITSNHQKMHGSQSQLAFLQGPFIKEAENGVIN